VNAPLRPPTANELLTDAGVQIALEEAWQDSQPHDFILRHEEGGWIYMDVANGQLTIVRALTGTDARINLHHPPTLAGAVVVGKFHTHPNPASEGWLTGPSADDIRTDAIHGVPDLIRAEDGIYLCGPSSRRGGLAGGGYPP
jgi:hypothetical protein